MQSQGFMASYNNYKLAQGKPCIQDYSYCVESRCECHECLVGISDIKEYQYYYQHTKSVCLHHKRCNCKGCRISKNLKRICDCHICNDIDCRKLQLYCFDCSTLHEINKK